VAQSQGGQAVKTAPENCPFCESPIMVHGGNLLRSEDGGFATYECKSSRDVQWSDPQWSRSGQTEVCRIREIMLLGRQLSVANKRIKRLEEAGNQMELVLISFQIFSDFRKSDSIRASLNWRKAKEAKP
jgi:hypothetical protein